MKNQINLTNNYFKFTIVVIGYKEWRMRMVNIKDVAKFANVSTATVSRIINDRPGANVETEKRVREAIKTLNYHPNNIARSLSNKSSNLIAFIVPNLNNPYFTDLINLLDVSAEKHGYKLYLCNSNDNSKNISYFLKSIVDNYIKTVIINSLAVTDEHIDYLKKHNITVITIDRTNLVNYPNAVSIDHYRGSYLATKYLIKNCKCNNIIFISGSMKEQSSISRFNGYKEAVEKYTKHQSIRLLEGDFTFASGYKLAKEELQKTTQIHGIVCANDAMAIGVIRACFELNIKIPEDVQIIGYDNCSLSSYTTPALTTVNQLDFKLGEIIMDAIDKGEDIKSELIPEIIMRETTKER